MPPRVAAWGGYDVDNYGDRLYPRVLEHELLRRDPELELALYGPVGLDAGGVAPLGPATAERRAELARDCDVVLIGGGELIHPLHWALARAYGLAMDGFDESRPLHHFVEGLGPGHDQPVAWHGVGVPFELDGEFAEAARRGFGAGAYVSVRDRASRARLERAGVTADIAVVPDSALLLPRILEPPSASDAIVVQGAGHVVELAPAIARAVARHRDGRPVILLSTFPNAGDDDFADAIEPLLQAPVERLPSPADPDDIATAIAGSAGFVGTSLHGAITAVAYGRPAAMIDTDERSKIEGFAEWVGLEDLVAHDAREVVERVGPALERPPAAETLGRLQSELDAHFDRLAEVVLS